MALPLTGIEQLFVGKTAEVLFGALNAGQTWKNIRFRGKAPRPTKKSEPQPLQKQGLWNVPYQDGRTNGEFSFDYDLRPKGSGSFAEAAWLLTWLLGKMHAAGHWIPSVCTGQFKQNLSTTGGEATTPTGAVVTDEGALVVVTDADGVAHVRAVTHITVNNPAGFDRLEWTPALPSAPPVDSHWYAIPTYYFDGRIDYNSLQFRSHGQDNDDFGQYLGCNASAVIKADSKADFPFLTLSIKVSYASSSYITGAAMVPETDDNGKPISLVTKAPLHLIAYATPGTARDSVLAVRADDSFELDLGLKLAPVASGGAEANGIAGWKATDDKGLMQGFFTTAYWDIDWHTAHESNTDLDLLKYCGNLTAGMAAIYVPRVHLGRPEDVDLGGLQGMKVPFSVQQNLATTSAGPNAVDAAIIKVGLYG